MEEVPLEGVATSGTVTEAVITASGAPAEMGGGRSKRYHHEREGENDDPNNDDYRSSASARGSIDRPKWQASNNNIFLRGGGRSFSPASFTSTFR